MNKRLLSRDFQYSMVLMVRARSIISVAVWPTCVFLIMLINMTAPPPFTSPLPQDNSFFTHPIKRSQLMQERKAKTTKTLMERCVCLQCQTDPSKQRRQCVFQSCGGFEAIPHQHHLLSQMASWELEGSGCVNLWFFLPYRGMQGCRGVSEPLMPSAVFMQGQAGVKTQQYS